MIAAIVVVAAIAAGPLNMTVQAGHRTGAHAVALSPDGQYLVSASGDLRVWDYRTGRLITKRALPAHVTNMVFLGRRLFLTTWSVPDHNRLLELAIPSGDIVQRANPAGNSGDVYLQAAGNNLVTLREKRIEVWATEPKLQSLSKTEQPEDGQPSTNIHQSFHAFGDEWVFNEKSRIAVRRADGTQRALLKGNAGVEFYELAVNKKADLIVAADNKGAFYVWRGSDFALVKSLTPYGARLVSAVAASDDGKLVIVSSPRDGVTVYNTSDFTVADSWKPKRDAGNFFNLPDDRIIAGNGDIYSTRRQRIVRSGDLSGATYAKQIVFSPSGNEIFVRDRASIRTISLPALTELPMLGVATDDSMSLMQHDFDPRVGEIVSAMDDQGRFALVSHMPDCWIGVRDTRSHRLIACTKQQVLTKDGKQPNLSVVRFSPNGQRFAWADFNGNFAVHEVSGKDIKTIHSAHKPSLAYWSIVIDWRDDNTVLFLSRSGRATFDVAQNTLSESAVGDQGYLKLRLGANGDYYGYSGKIARFTAAGKLVGETKTVVDGGQSNAFDDAGVLYAGSHLGQLMLLDPNTLDIVKTIETGSDGIESIAFDRQKRFIALLSTEGIVRILDRKTHDLVVSVLVHPGGAMGFYTPDNYYTMSRNGFSRVHFVRDQRVISVESYDLAYNRPDVVAQRIGLSEPAFIEQEKRAWMRRLKKLGLSEVPPAGDLPSIKLIAQPPEETGNKSAALQLQASQAGAPLKYLRVWSNGVPVGPSLGFAVSGASATMTIEVPLVFGRNSIQLAAVDEKGLESERQWTEVHRTSTPAAQKTYVLALGTSKYVTAKWNLEYAAKDAIDYAAAMAKRGDTQTLVLTDKEVTKEHVLEAGKKLFAQAKVDDTLVVFVAGHGLLSDNLEYFYASHDIDFNAPEKKGIAYDHLEALFDGSPARRRVVFVDTCHAGELEDETVEQVPLAASSGMKVVRRATRGLRVIERTKRPTDAARSMVADLARGSGAIVIGSSGGAEFALESKKFKNGVFTFSLLEALQKAQRLSTQELRSQVSARVVELTNGAQRPVARREQLEFDFEL